MDILDNNDIGRIEQELNINVSRGINTIIDAIVYTLTKLCIDCNVDLRDQEVLVIGDDTENTGKVVYNLANEIRFLALCGRDKDFASNLKDEIFNDTGLSIHTTENIIKNLSNYNVIINLSSRISLEVNKIKKKSVVFDFSLEKWLSKEMESKRKDIMCITDMIFRNNSNVICDLDYCNFNKELPSYIYEVINEVNVTDLMKVKIRDKNYTIKEALNTYFKLNYKKSILKIK